MRWGRSTADRIADLGRCWRRRRHNGHHVFDARTGDAGHQSGTPLKLNVEPKPITKLASIKNLRLVVAISNFGVVAIPASMAAAMVSPCDRAKLGRSVP
jgi:hypothetical protein